jgi:succinate dehydrogenase / fumarate reductase cytochrome b subunit
MSATANRLTANRAARFWNATIGKKAVMAVSGIALFGFVCAHLLGNLNFFRGPDAMNDYAAALRTQPALLTIARAGLLVMVILHLWASLQLLALNRFKARPVAYMRKKSIASSYASRTMYWSGPIIAAFVIYHLMQFTWGIGGTAFEELHPYENLIAGFSNPFIAVAYIVAVGMLMLHLYHGLWSIFQTLGLNHPRYSPALKAFARAVSILLFAGFISIPIAVLVGVRP